MRLFICVEKEPGNWALGRNKLSTQPELSHKRGDDSGPDEDEDAGGGAGTALAPNKIVAINVSLDTLNTLQNDNKPTTSPQSHPPS